MNFDVGTFATHVPTDWIIIVAAALLIGLESYRSGTSRACAIALSFPMAQILFAALPGTLLVGKMISSIQTSYAQVAAFAILVVISYFLLHRILYSFDTGGVGFIQALLCGISAAIMITIVWIQIPALQELFHLGEGVEIIFGDPYRLGWLIVSLGALAFVRS